MTLRDSIHHEILKRHYECLVCLENITAKTPVWSCQSCYRVFDLKCIRKCSAKTEASAKHFKCPHCMILQRKDSLKYKCWCRKTTLSSQDKRAINSLDAVPPHSCGQTCGAKRKCPHPCPLTCHAGPHEDSAKCMHIGPKIKCFCGRESQQVPCTDTPYGGFSCEQRCNMKNRICGHKCLKQCHEFVKSPRSKGENAETCGPCDRIVIVDCFCGKMHKKRVKCSELPLQNRKAVRSTRDKTTISCGQPCTTEMDCGLHKCEHSCHPQSENEALHICKLKPFEGETCFCGKIKANRQRCTDPKLSCGLVCQKKQSCGHECQHPCHEGPCPPCSELVVGVTCRCGRSTVDGICGDIRRNVAVCQKKCGANLSCGRHHCNRKCCEYHPKAMHDLALRKKSVHDQLLYGPNYQQRSINKKSRSKQNRLLASSASSSGSSSSAELVGADGIDPTVLLEGEAVELALLEQSALSTHTCRSICGRLLACQAHTCPRPCHPGPCPPCLSASFEEWVCPCGSTRLEPPIRCGTTMPFCKSRCHREQPCGHRATHLCHADEIECAPCTELVTKSCLCGKHEVKTRCSETNVRCRDPCGNQLDCGHVCQRLCCTRGDACLPCTNWCLQKFEKCGHPHEVACHYPEPCPEECNAQLYAKCHCGAIGLPYTCGEDLEISCNDTCIKESYPEQLLEAFREDPVWFSTIETKIVSFVQSDKRTIWFQPMGATHRSFLHMLLQMYNINSESIDYGKMRSVCGRKTGETALRKFRLKTAPRKRPYIEKPIPARILLKPRKDIGPWTTAPDSDNNNDFDRVPNENENNDQDEDDNSKSNGDLAAQAAATLPTSREEQFDRPSIIFNINEGSSTESEEDEVDPDGFITRKGKSYSPASTEPDEEDRLKALRGQKYSYVHLDE